MIRQKRERVLAPKAKERQGTRTDLAHSPNLGGCEERRTAKTAAVGTGYSGTTLDKVRTIRDAGVDVVARYDRDQRGYVIQWRGGPDEEGMRAIAAGVAEDFPDSTSAPWGGVEADRARCPCRRMGPVGAGPSGVIDRGARPVGPLVSQRREDPMQITAVIATHTDAPDTPLIHSARDGHEVALDPDAVRYSLAGALGDESYGRAAVVVIEVDDAVLLRYLAERAVPVIEGAVTED